MFPLRHGYMGLTSSLQVTASFGPLATEKVTCIALSPSPSLAIVFWRLKHYLRIIVCRYGVYIEIYGRPKWTKRAFININK